MMGPGICFTLRGNTLRRILAGSVSLSVPSILTLILLSIGLTGCSNKGYTSGTPGSALTGTVIGGQNPITGATIQLYAVGTTGDGSAATPLISGTLTTSDGSNQVNSNANAGNTNNTLPAGSFTITNDYQCPTASSEVYLISTGGNPGLGTGVNPNISLMTALGQCSNLSSTNFVVINELTTVSSIAALSNFSTSYSSVGSATSDASQLQAQFAEVNEYANTANGTVPGPALPAGYSASSTAIQTLGDIVAACINTAGGSAGQSNPCGNLFTLATIGSNPAPTDTIGAIINILNQPTVNVAQIFNLLPGTNPFLPTLSNPPATWALPITSNTATKLTFTSSPSNTPAGSPISPAVTVTIEDANNNPQTSATNPVTLAIGTNPGTGTLAGKTTVNAVNGVATFSGLTINTTGNGYTLAASAAGLTAATSGTFNITSANASIYPPGNTIVGNNFVTHFTIGLQLAPIASDTFTIASSDSTHFLVSLLPAAVGSASISTTVSAGGSIPVIYLEGQNYTGTTAITATLTITDSLNQYTPTNTTVTLYPSGLGFDTTSVSTTSFSSSTPLYVSLLGLTPGTLTAAFQGILGPQATNSPTFTITSGTPATGTISGNPASYRVNGSNYNSSTLDFVPVSAGTSTLTLNIPTGYFACTSSDWPTSIVATVSTPEISIPSITVGNNFIASLNLSLQAPPPTTETMTITSNDPTHFLLSTSPAVIGSASVNVTLTSDSTAVPSVYLQGQNFNNNPTAITTTVTASATGYSTGSTTETLYPSGLGFSTASFTTGASSSPTALSVGLIALTPGTLTEAFTGILGPQAASPSFTITSGTTATGTISGNPGTFTVDGSAYNNTSLAFVPAADGSSTLTLNQPAGYTASTSSNWPSQITATVSGP
jgi:hypothetical protein